MIDQDSLPIEVKGDKKIVLVTILIGRNSNTVLYIYRIE